MVNIAQFYPFLQYKGSRPTKINTGKSASATIHPSTLIIQQYNPPGKSPLNISKLSIVYMQHTILIDEVIWDVFVIDEANNNTAQYT